MTEIGSWSPIVGGIVHSFCPFYTSTYAFEEPTKTSDRDEISAAFNEWLQPEAVTVEESDLSHLVQNVPMRVSFQHNWDSIAPELSRLALGELFPTLESVARRLFNARPAPAATDDEKWLQSAITQLPVAIRPNTTATATVLSLPTGSYEVLFNQSLT